MRNENLDIAEVFRKVPPKGLHAEHQRIYQAITRCRTAALGGHVMKCVDCGHREQAYNSCWNRHCPKCQGGAAFQWTAARMQELLPVAYYHVVFTLPSELRELCFHNKRIFYELLYTSSSRTLLDVAQNNEGVQLGFLGVLHSWNQELGYHPHIHYIVAGGGLSKDSRWRYLSRGNRFLLPVRVLSQVFRGKAIEMLKKLYGQGELYLGGKLSHLKDPRAFEKLLNQAAKKPWAVYAKRPFAGPEVVLKYLAHYTHRVAISNRRLRAITTTTVSFLARDRERKHKKRLVTLPHALFMRRFLQHTLPKGFRRIRYFGFLANSDKTARLAHLRAQLKVAPLSPPELPQLEPSCINCGSKTLVRLELHYNPHSHNQEGHTRPQIVRIACLSPPLAA